MKKKKTTLIKEEAKTTAIIRKKFSLFAFIFICLYLNTLKYLQEYVKHAVNMLKEIMLEKKKKL